MNEKKIVNLSLFAHDIILYVYICVCMYMSEKAIATHSGTLAWKIPWTEEPGGLQSMGSPRIRHD